MAGLGLGIPAAERRTVRRIDLDRRNALQFESGGWARVIARLEHVIALKDEQIPDRRQVNGCGNAREGKK